MSVIQFPDPSERLVRKRRLRGEAAIFENSIGEIGPDRISIMAHIIIQTAWRHNKILTVIQKKDEYDHLPWVYVVGGATLSRLAQATKGNELSNVDYSEMPGTIGGAAIVIGTTGPHRKMLGSSMAGFVADERVRVWIPGGKAGNVGIQDKSGPGQGITVLADWTHAFMTDSLGASEQLEGDDSNVIPFPQLKAN